MPRSAKVSFRTACRPMVTTPGSATTSRIFTNVNSAVVDPKNFDQNSFVDATHRHLRDPAQFLRSWRGRSSILRIPRDVLEICVGKSTYARCGIIVNVTPLEPRVGRPRDAGVLQHDSAARAHLRQRGRVPVPVPSRQRACEVSYRDKAGKYQGQRGVTLPKICAEKTMDRIRIRGGRQLKGDIRSPAPRTPRCR